MKKSIIGTITKIEWGIYQGTDHRWIYSVNVNCGGKDWTSKLAIDTQLTPAPKHVKEWMTTKYPDTLYIDSVHNKKGFQAAAVPDNMYTYEGPEVG